MTSRSSPEEFLREFAGEVLYADSPEKHEATIKGWVKILELREREAELRVRNELIAICDKEYELAERRGEEMTSRNRARWARENETMGESYSRNQGFKSGCLTIKSKIQLTTPNNTTNTPEDEKAS